MASDWTEERLEHAIRHRWRPEKMTGEELTDLLTTALDALRARPRWVAVEDFDPETMRVVGEFENEKWARTLWVPVVPLPLPPLPEEGE